MEDLGYIFMFTAIIAMICFAATVYYDKKHKSQSAD